MIMSVDDWKNYYGKSLQTGNCTHEDLKKRYEEHKKNKTVWSYGGDKQSYQNAQIALEELLDLSKEPTALETLAETKEYLQSR